MKICFLTQDDRKSSLKAIAASLLVLLVFLAHSVDSYSMDADDQSVSFEDDSSVVVVNRPVNIQGMTGLLFTNSAYTQPAGHVAVGFSGLYENNDTPDFSYVQGGGTITIGLTDRIEVGVKGKVIATNIGSSATRDSGVGDTDLLIKWRFSSQGVYMPALAFGLAWKFPTGDDTKGLREVNYEGVKLMVMGTSEKRVLEDTFVGVYFDAEAVFNDQYYGQYHNDGDATYKDQYGIVNAGLLFPISTNNRMQVMVEYNRVFKKDIETLYELGYKAITPGLRYVTENFNITVGVQRMDIDYAGSPGNKRYVGTLGYRF